MKYRTFQPQFHPGILAGTKTSTIRGMPWCQVGDRVALRYWTGAAYRSKMGTLGTVIVRQVCPVTIETDKIWINGIEALPFSISQQEGFASHTEMWAWFQKTHGLPYSGTLTRWDPATLEVAP